MALTRELLQANTALAGLTDEQISTITTLSSNDENAVIAKKTGEIYGALDSDILSVSGMEKDGTEKTYTYMKRVMEDYRNKASGMDSLNDKVAELSKENERLNKVIAEGGNDAESKKALAQAKADLTSITNSYNELNTKYQQIQDEHTKELFAMKIDNELTNAISKVKFKANLPETVVKVIIQNATDKVKGMHPEYIDNGEGGKVIAFKGENGEYLRNPNNQLNIYTPAELLIKELDDMSVLDKGRKQAGGGTNTHTIQNAKGGVDATGAKTRMEAYDMIEKSLTAQGLKIGTKEFDSAMTQAWKDNNIQSLPEK